MTALPLEARQTTATEHAAAATHCAVHCALLGRSCALEVSRARTHDAVLVILNAYKLSGNFHGNLEAVLKDMGVFDLVTYRIEPRAMLAFPDRRHVVFSFNGDLAEDRCDDIARAIKARIGFDTPWWGRLIYRRQAEAGSAAQCRRQH